MKTGQIRPLYLEPRLHKQSVKQEINKNLKLVPTNGNCLKAMTSISKKRDSIFVADCLLTSPSSKPFTRFEF
jgi:hypothetical protein